MSIVAVRDSPHGMAKDFDRRLGKMLVVIRRTSLPKIVEHPGLFFPLRRAVACASETSAGNRPDPAPRPKTSRRGGANEPCARCVLDFVLLVRQRPRRPNRETHGPLFVQVGQVAVHRSNVPHSECRGILLARSLCWIARAKVLCHCGFKSRRHR
jgi:hypothetical protein